LAGSACGQVSRELQRVQDVVDVVAAELLDAFAAIDAAVLDAEHDEPGLGEVGHAAVAVRAELSEIAVAAAEHDDHRQLAPRRDRGGLPDVGGDLQAVRAVEGQGAVGGRLQLGVVLLPGDHGAAQTLGGRRRDAGLDAELGLLGCAAQLSGHELVVGLGARRAGTALDQLAVLGRGVGGAGEEDKRGDEAP
jgi:hypothetical protein